MDKNEHPQVATVIDAVKDFLRLESASGVLLVVATILAMIVANSPIQHLYDVLLDTPVEIRVGAFQIDKPLLLWVNDGLMALFFFLVGLELKREVTRGELSDPAKVTVPVMAAVGGMAVPAMIYSAINWGDAVAMQGWAIPSATDIAFAMGVLALLGDRVPSSLKLFLLTLAIVDDLGAIVIIALFYSHGLSWTALGTAAIALVVLWQMNRRGVIAIAPYMVIGLILWAAVLKSGVHATLAGVLVAAFIPLKKTDEEGCSPLERLEHDLHPTVAYLILPVFAFMNTGISLQGVTLASLFAPIPLGIAAGLFFGNQIGVMGMSYLAIKLRLGSLPEGANWTQLYGVSLLCGIGFTMSLFISSLAFEQGGQSSPLDDRLGILFGSLLAAFSGYAVLRLATRHKTGDEDSPAAD